MELDYHFLQSNQINEIQHYDYLVKLLNTNESEIKKIIYGNMNLSPSSFEYITKHIPLEKNDFHYFNYNNINLIHYILEQGLKNKEIDEYYKYKKDGITKNKKGTRPFNIVELNSNIYQDEATIIQNGILSSKSYKQYCEQQEVFNNVINFFGCVSDFFNKNLLNEKIFKNTYLDKNDIEHILYCYNNEQFKLNKNKHYNIKYRDYDYMLNDLLKKNDQNIISLVKNNPDCFYFTVSGSDKLYSTREYFKNKKNVNNKNFEIHKITEKGDLFSLISKPYLNNFENHSFIFSIMHDLSTNYLLDMKHIRLKIYETKGLTVKLFDKLQLNRDLQFNYEDRINIESKNYLLINHLVNKFDCADEEISKKIVNDIISNFCMYFKAENVYHDNDKEGFYHLMDNIFNNKSDFVKQIFIKNIRSEIYSNFRSNFLELCHSQSDDNPEFIANLIFKRKYNNTDDIKNLLEFSMDNPILFKSTQNLFEENFDLIKNLDFDKNKELIVLIKNHPCFNDLEKNSKINQMYNDFVLVSNSNKTENIKKIRKRKI